MFSNCENTKSNVFNGDLIRESYIIHFDWILHEYTLKLPFVLKTKNIHKCISYKSDIFIITSIEKRIYLRGDFTYVSFVSEKEKFLVGETLVACVHENNGKTKIKIDKCSATTTTT